MASLTVHGIEDELVRRLRQRAADHGRSPEAEHQEILRAALDRTAVRPERADILHRLADFRERTAERTTGSAVDLLKRTREERTRQLTRHHGRR